MKATELPVSDAVTQGYQRDGYHVAHDLLTAKECEELKIEAMRVLREHGRPGATVYVGVAAASPTYSKLADHPRIVTILEKIMPDGVAFLSDKFVFKSGEKKFATPWHYDAAYWPNTRPKLSVWIALDDCSAENGALKVLPGSHRREWQHVRSDKRATNDEFDNVIPESQWKSEDELVCEIKKGGAIFFSDRLLHASCENPAGLDRYAIISTYHAPAEDEDFDKRFAARHVIVRKR